MNSPPGEPPAMCLPISGGGGGAGCRPEYDTAAALGDVAANCWTVVWSTNWSSTGTSVGGTTPVAG